MPRVHVGASYLWGLRVRREWRALNLVWEAKHVRFHKFLITTTAFSSQAPNSEFSGPCLARLPSQAHTQKNSQFCGTNGTMLKDIPQHTLLTKQPERLECVRLSARSMSKSDCRSSAARSKGN